jgi:enoyl-CoA hydratase/carnithine racemase
MDVGRKKMDERVCLTINGHVAHIELARPDKMNAIDRAMIEGLIAAADRLRAASAVRAVVLSGAGRSFCAGIDLGSLRDSAEGNPQAIDIASKTRKGMNIAQYAVMQWRTLPIPVIAAVHGAAFGGGFQICLGADIRIVHPAAKLSVMEAKWGLIPDMAGFYLLSRLVRRDVAAELIWSARIFDGVEAHALGLATRLADAPLDAALALAADIASFSPDAIRAAKRMLSLTEATKMLKVLGVESSEQSALLNSANQKEAVRAGLARTAPNFVDPAP